MRQDKPAVQRLLRKKKSAQATSKVPAGGQRYKRQLRKERKVPQATRKERNPANSSFTNRVSSYPEVICSNASDVVR